MVHALVSRSDKKRVASFITKKYGLKDIISVSNYMRCWDLLKNNLIPSFRLHSESLTLKLKFEQ